jgi:hypothetical protein
MKHSGPSPLDLGIYNSLGRPALLSMPERWAAAAMFCATLQAGVPAARSRWQRGRLVLVELGCAGIRCADAVNVIEMPGSGEVPVRGRCALACSAGRGPRRGRDVPRTGERDDLPASCPSRPLRDGRRFARVAGSGRFPSAPFNRGAEGKLRDGGITRRGKRCPGNVDLANGRARLRPSRATFERLGSAGASPSRVGAFTARKFPLFPLLEQGARETITIRSRQRSAGRRAAAAIGRTRAGRSRVL